jgi:hypothetical protein
MASMRFIGDHGLPTGHPGLRRRRPERGSGHRPDALVGVERVRSVYVEAGSGARPEVRFHVGCQANISG